MKNFTTAQRNEIYEHLLTLDCPDLLASLIAQRADKNFMKYEASKYTSLVELIADAFIWEETKEGWEFWFEVQECLLYAEEYDTPTIADVIESTEKEAFDSAMKAPLKIEVQFEDNKPYKDAFSSVDNLPPLSDNLSTAELSLRELVRDIKNNKEEPRILFSQDLSPVSSEPLSFWTKVKLFFGKWFYKV